MAYTQGAIHSPCSPSSMCSTSSTSSTSSCKSVQFSRFIKISFTYPGDEYDRSALQPARLTMADVSELRQMRSHWQRESREREDAFHSDDSDVSDSSLDDSDSSLSSSPPSSPDTSCPYHSRIHPHSLLQCTSIHCSHSSPPCSPVLSHQDSSSSCSEDEYEPTHPTLTPQQQQQYQRLKRFSGSRPDLKSMMHRHHHLDQTKENVQCLA